ncbi:MAG: hypothetical protein A4S09_15020 [Proteobacteria bacterium SG_bin7]|nr:MAG: hypothetical protein A4S09_15020 [Proteobacteria bacterium SG_bin7]
MKQILICLLLSIYFSNAQAADFHWKFGVDMKDQSLADGEQKFVIDDWTCTVGEAKPDKFGNEMRRFGCGLGNGLQVYLLTVCTKDKKTGKPRSENGVLNLQMKHTGSKMVSLECK